MKYYEHHIGDFDKATRHLSRIERSIYRDMIEVYYDTEDQLTLDFDALCRKLIAKSDEERTAVQQTLNEFFTKTPNGWYHDACEELISGYRSNTSQKSLAGKASAAAKALRKQQALNGNSTVVEQTNNGTSTNHKPLTTNQEPIKNSAEKDDAFESAWSIYPKRPGASKADSLKAWKARIKSGVKPEDMINGVKRYAEFVRIKKTEPDYIKLPTTFFGPGEHYAADWKVDASIVAGQGSRHSGFELLDYSEGIENGRIT